ncbi:stage III sporulation protein AC [Cellulosilyticum sp. I15G10I2]|uniref:stage III sporulation protein AC n=1 Tax=Cellulosilyticum sp. I15G10I2 TaxID=1892843 RepID=UPI00085C43D0|nr:stage III sporulation protein AC [Cellulosilyticum sp. I15G10I2]
MFDIEIIFKLAGLGLGITIINTVLKKTGAEEWIFPITIVGVVMALLVVIEYILKLFEVVQTMFAF